MSFVQALMAIGYRPIPLSGGPGQKVVDIAIQRTLAEPAQPRRRRRPRQQRRRLPRAGRGSSRRAPDRTRRVHRVPQQRLHRLRRARAGVLRPRVRHARLQRAPAARADHPDRRLRPGRLPLMRLLVLGGTQFLSREVAAQAARAGHEVVCANRGRSGTAAPGTTTVHWDRDEPAPPDLTAAGPYDAVVDVARQPQHVRHALAAVPDAHWVFVSTISVYADVADPAGPGTGRLHEPVGEDYGALKVACEEPGPGGGPRDDRAPRPGRRAGRPERTLRLLGAARRRDGCTGRAGAAGRAGPGDRRARPRRVDHHPRRGATGDDPRRCRSGAADGGPRARGRPRRGGDLAAGRLPRRAGRGAVGRSGQHPRLASPSRARRHAGPRRAAGPRRRAHRAAPRRDGPGHPGLAGGGPGGRDRRHHPRAGGRPPHRVEHHLVSCGAPHRHRQRQRHPCGPPPRLR
ncbi:hypothetical protein [Nocardioides convexus]|uniref:hypothetical protein n=1 Tax=Nocardioides convexus TaxID=2712224 RepID=UPI0024182E08|nr:hypothetical protein [Nocardioides convexus]